MNMLFFTKNHDKYYHYLFPFSYCLPWLIDDISSFLEKFDTTSNSVIVHLCMLPYKMAPISLFIHEKRHSEKGLLMSVATLLSNAWL